MSSNSSGANLAWTAWTCKGRVPRYKLLRWGARERHLRRAYAVKAAHLCGFVRYTPKACRWGKFGEITIPKVERGVVHGHHSSKAGRSGAASLPQSGRRRPCLWAASCRETQRTQTARANHQRVAGLQRQNKPSPALCVAFRRHTDRAACEEPQLLKLAQAACYSMPL